MGYLFGARSCHCGCEICQHCTHPCLSVTFADWSETCDCGDLNGTHLLSRGGGRKPKVNVAITATTGSGAVVVGVLTWDDETGTYSLSDVTITNPGSGYSSDVSGSVEIEDGVVGCGDAPTVDISLAERTQPTALEFDTWDATAPVTFTIAWAAENVTAGSETWSVDSFTIVDGGSGQQDLSGTNPATPQPAGIEEVQPFGGMTWEVDRAEPVLDSFSVTTAGGSGATFTPNWAVDAATQAFIQGLGYADGRYWQIGLPSITGGGTGYALGDVVEYTLSGEHQTYGEWPNAPASRYAATVTGIGGSGEITELTISAAQDLHIRSDGTVVSIIIYDYIDRGEYYIDNGIEATVTNPGTIHPEESCTYTKCDVINCGSGDVCRKITLEIGSTTRTLTVTVGEAVVATATISSEGNPCGDMEFSSGDFTGPCTAGSVTVESAPCSGGPSDQACCRPPCESCAGCCLYIMGRNTCEGGCIGDCDLLDGDHEIWGIDAGDFLGPYWIKKEGGVTRVVTFTAPECASGVWSSYGFSSIGGPGGSKQTYYPTDDFFLCDTPCRGVTFDTWGGCPRGEPDWVSEGVDAVFGAPPGEPISPSDALEIICDEEA